MRTLKWMTVFASLVLISQAIQAQGKSGRVDITGDAAVEIADFFDEDRSELYYFIVDKQSKARTQLFLPDLPDAAFKSGAKVRVRGVSRGKGKGVDVETIEVIEAAPDPFGTAATSDEATAESPVASAKTRKVLTLVVNFLDAVADNGGPNGVTPQIIKDRMFNETKNVQHFYDLASLGTLTIPTDPNGIGKEPVFGPYTINYNYLTANGGTCIAGTWADAALDMWEADTVGNPAGETRSDYDNWSIIVPNYWDYSGRACSWGGYAGVGCTQCWAFSADPASILHGVVIHELGHNFGFGHARFDTDNDGSSDCEYCDSSDLMGGSRNWMKFNAAHFNYLGWWDPVSYEIDTVSPSSTEQEFHLLPVDEEDGPWPGLRAVKTARTGSSNYFFSFRQQTGHYDNVTSSYTNGVNIHWSSSNNYSYFYRMLEPGGLFFDATQDLVVWAIGETTVDDGLGNFTDVFTIKLCNSTCSTLWPAFNLAASGTFPNTIGLTWEDNTYNEDGWRIDYSTDGTVWSELTTVAADSTSYSHFGLSGGTTLFYRIRAYRGGSETSDWSNTVSATTPPASGNLGFPIISGDDDTLEYTGPYTGQMYPNWDYLWLGYDSGNAATNDEGLRFQNVTIPQGATINSAFINYFAYSSASGDTSIRFRTEDVDNAAPFTTASSNLTSRTFGSAFVDWTLPTSWANGSAHQSPDLASILQPIVDREGWGGGNSVVFITQGNPDPTGNHRVRSYNYGSTWAPVLQVDFTWTPAGPVAPTASFTHSTYSLDATFSDTSTDSDGNVVGWSWDFGDTNTSTLQNPVHTYASGGTYTVGLTVTDTDGETDNTSQSVTIMEDTEPPVITVSGDDPALVDQYEPYTDAGATATDNLDGDLTGSISTIGLPVDTDIAGDVTVDYSVFDGSGNEGTASRTVTVVANQDPVADFLFSTTGLSVDFTDTSSDADGSVVAWSWDFGDSGSSSAQSPTHIYTGDGSFTVMLTVTDDDGHTGQTSQSITLLAAPDELAATPDAIDSIHLSWNDNSSVETGYVIERSPGGAGSWVQIGSVGASVGVFNDNTDLSDGSIYDYRVKATGAGYDSAWSNLASVTTFVCSASKTYTGGEWYQFALACDPGPYNTVAHIFSSLEPLVYEFDAVSAAYTRLESDDTMVPGTGYWINFFRTLDYTLSGYDTVSADISLVTDVVGTNNLIGFPGNGTVAWSDVLIVDGAQTKTLLEADPWENGPSPVNRVCDLPSPTSKCLMSRKLRIWGGSKAAGAYQVYDPDVPGQEGSLVPLDGLWVKAFKSGVKLRIPAPAAPAPGAEASVAPAPVDLATVESDGVKSKTKGKQQDKSKRNKNKGVTWHVRLIAESGDLRDPGNTLGHKNGSIQGQDARDLEEPPPFAGDHLSILVTNPLFEETTWGFTTDFRAPADSPAGEWPFLVKASGNSEPVTLSWKAESYDFTDAWLVDLQTGERVAVTAGGSYTFQPIARESRFVFIIE